MVWNFVITLAFVQQVVISQKSKNHEKPLDVFQVMLDKKNDNFYLI